MIDGLSALQAKRDKATKSARHLPPPRHTSPKQEAPKKPEAPAPAAPASPPHKASRPTPEKTEPATASAPASAALVRATIYLREADDSWLEDISTLGRSQRPRVDASRSAVARLALDRLAEQMTPAEIVALLGERAQASTQSVGRKRL